MQCFSKECYKDMNKPKTYQMKTQGRVLNILFFVSVLFCFTLIRFGLGFGLLLVVFYCISFTLFWFVGFVGFCAFGLFLVLILNVHYHLNSGAKLVGTIWSRIFCLFIYL